MKLAVGVRDIAHLQELQVARVRATPPLRHLTRNRPRRAAEVLDGGSIYWVIGGVMLVRQRLLDLGPAPAPDGTARAALLLDSTLVPVVPRATRPFQGWRYLPQAAAPPDLATAVAASGAEAMPTALRQELRALGLL